MGDEKNGRIHALLSKGVREKVYPGAVLLVARGGETVFFHQVGHRSLIPHIAPMEKDTIFDLASLTKPLATALATMKVVDQGRMELDQPIAGLLPRAVPKDKSNLTPRMLLSHCAGFPEWRPFYLELDHVEPEKRKDLLRERLLNIPLVYQPGGKTLYSDLGFILLEWIIEEKAEVPMHEFLDRHFYRPMSLERTFFNNEGKPTRFGKDQFASTEECPWRGEIMLGSVHDENAYAMGGYSGHAGLFGTAEEVFLLVDFLRRHYRGERSDYLKPETVKAFLTRQDIVDGSTWALGWDTPSPQKSSAGKHFSEKSVGHLGFTGTSIWMDLEKNIIVIFLTNRIHPTRSNEKIRAFRPVLHDLVMEEFDSRIRGYS